MRIIQSAKAILVYVMLVCISFMIPNLSSAKLDADALLGIWFFDEGKGGEAKDASENGNNGEIVDAQWVTGLIDEIAFFNVALSGTDVKAIADSGLSVALGFAAVSPQAKLATAWAKLKRETGTR